MGKVATEDTLLSLKALVGNVFSDNTAVELVNIFKTALLTEEMRKHKLAFKRANVPSDDSDITIVFNTYINAEGVETSTTNGSFKVTPKFPVRQNDAIEYTLYGLNNVSCVIAAYDENDNFLLANSIIRDASAENAVNAKFSGTYVVPKGVAYLRFGDYSFSENYQNVYLYVPYYVDVPVLKNANISGGGNGVAENHWKGKKWVAFGTSLTDNYSDNAYIDGTDEPSGKYVTYLKEMGKFDAGAFVNRGMAGGRICGHILHYIRHYLANHVTFSDYTADLVTIEGSVNDFAGDVPLGEVGDTVPYTSSLLDDSTDEGTFAGGCYCAFKEAMEAAPNAVVVFLTDSTGRNREGYTDFSWGRKNNHGLYQNDYIEMAIKVARFVGIPVIDCGRDSMINAANPQYIVDHIHHSYLGGEQYAATIWNKLKDIPCKVVSLD